MRKSILLLFLLLFVFYTAENVYALNEPNAKQLHDNMIAAYQALVTVISNMKDPGAAGSDPVFITALQDFKTARDSYCQYVINNGLMQTCDAPAIPDLGQTSSGNPPPLENPPPEDTPPVDQNPPTPPPPQLSIKITSPSNSATIATSKFTVTASYTSPVNDPQVDFYLGSDYLDSKYPSGESGSVAYSIDMSKNKAGKYTLMAGIQANGANQFSETITINYNPQSQKPPSPATGMVSIDSAPSGAAIQIDNFDTNAITPVTLRDVQPGPHTVTLVKADHETYSQTVTVTAGSTVRIFANLNPTSSGDDIANVVLGVGGAVIVITIITKLIGVLKGIGGAGAAGGGMIPRPPIKGRITDNPVVQTPLRKPPPPLRRIQQTPEDIRIEQRQIEEMEVRKKEIQENMKESEKEAKRQNNWANFWDWMSYGAEKVQSGADIGVDVLSNVTGPAGQNIKKVYTVTKDLTKNMSEGYASGTGVWEGAKKGAAEATTDLILDYGAGKITDLTGGKIPGLKKFENVGNEFGYGERSLSSIKNVLTAKPDDAADELKQIIMKNAFKNAGKSTAQGFGQGYATDPIKKVMGNKIGYDF